MNTMAGARPDAGARGEPSSLELFRATRRWAKPNFREYTVWKEAVSFATCVYEVTGKMPWFEKKIKN